MDIDMGDISNIVSNIDIDTSNIDIDTIFQIVDQNGPIQF